MLSPFDEAWEPPEESIPGWPVPPADASPAAKRIYEKAMKIVLERRKKSEEETKDMDPGFWQK